MPVVGNAVNQLLQQTLHLGLIELDLYGFFFDFLSQDYHVVDHLELILALEFDVGHEFFILKVLLAQFLG